MTHLEKIRTLETPKDRRDYLNKIHFKTCVWSQNGTYYAQVEELGLLTKGDDATTVLNEIESKKTKYLDLIVESEGEDRIQYPKLISFDEEDKKKLILFSLKSFIFSMIFALSLGLSLSGVVSDISTELDRLDYRLTKAFNPSEEKQKERIERFREKVKVIKPYVDILKEEL